MIDALACGRYVQVIIFSFRKWILRLAVEKHLPEKRKREMCTSAPTLNVFPEPNLPFPEAGCPWQPSGYMKLGWGFSDISAVTSG